MLISHQRLAQELSGYIQCRCREGDIKALRITRLAKKFLVSERLLTAVFKSEFQLTIHHFIMTQKMGIAKELLLRGLAIKNIAYQLGYTATANFSRDFRKWVGVSPQCYRKLIVVEVGVG